VDKNKEVSDLKVKLALLQQQRTKYSTLKAKLVMLKEQRVENHLMHKKINIIV
jgi:hypothetical protein